MAGQLGMWMPKQKEGKNWKVIFSLNWIDNGEVVTDRTKTFRVRQDAADWVESVKNLTVEANEVREPQFSNFTFKISKLEKV